ncbi:hypothetical protein [Lihuaxuella thermophila]|uniref:Uncharacterized protein n=1 Tax=Lihuaxuella thermophila TaxID=1173111 RepID=A0A1H8GWT5_9BACL|nr:hypothetical protein [Lihuaxuella thermophila]SEN48601.1 hypothetical protein SAMN05444955_112116 [Lihuaxuella thermophila]
MSQEKTGRYITGGQAVSYVVYTLAKLGYPREKIVEIVKELINTFELKCDVFTSNAGLKGGREDRKHLLPTISNREGVR